MVASPSGSEGGAGERRGGGGHGLGSGRNRGGDGGGGRGGGRLLAVLGRIAHDLAHVVLRLGERRNSAVALDRAGAGVVGGQRLRRVAAELVELLAQVLRATLDRLRGDGRVHAERGGGARHELRQAAGAGGARRGGGEVS